jgi:hypothetical protein
LFSGEKQHFPEIEADLKNEKQRKRQGKEKK